MKDEAQTDLSVYPLAVVISIALITLNEEANLARTLESVMPLVRDGQGEIIVVDSGSTDRTWEIACSYGAEIFVEPWKGFAAQKNSAMEKASGDWVLQLDADEALEPELAEEINWVLLAREEWIRQGLPTGTDPRSGNLRKHGLGYGADYPTLKGFLIPRKNFFLGRCIKHGGFYPDKKLRLIRRGAGKFEEYGAHPTIKVNGPIHGFKHALIPKSYPTPPGYLENRKSTPLNST